MAIRTYLSKMRGSSSAGIPTPSSSTAQLDQPVGLAARAATRTSPPRGEYLTALESRFLHHAVQRVADPRAGPAAHRSAFQRNRCPRCTAAKSSSCRSTWRGQIDRLPLEVGGHARPRSGRDPAAPPTMRPSRRASAWRWHEEARRRARAAPRACRSSSRSPAARSAACAARARPPRGTRTSPGRARGAGAVAAATLSSSSSAKRRWRRVRRAFSTPSARCSASSRPRRAVPRGHLAPPLDRQHPDQARARDEGQDEAAHAASAPAGSSARTRGSAARSALLTRPAGGEAKAAADPGSTSVAPAARWRGRGASTSAPTRTRRARPERARAARGRAHRVSRIGSGPSRAGTARSRAARPAARARARDPSQQQAREHADGRRQGRATPARRPSGAGEARALDGGQHHRHLEEARPERRRGRPPRGAPAQRRPEPPAPGRDAGAAQAGPRRPRPAPRDRDQQAERRAAITTTSIR